ADVLAWGTISGPAGFDLVTDADGASTAAPYYVGRVTNYSTDVNAGGIVRLSGGTQTLTANRVVDALLLEGGATIDGPFTLQIGAGSATNQHGLIVVDGGNSTLAASLLDFDSPANPREALLNVRAGSLTITSTIDASNGNALRKEGVGALTLSGDNDTGVATGQLASAIVVNAGTLTITHEDALGSEPGGSVTINRRAALILNATDNSLTIGNKAILLNGYGLNDNYTGALRTTGSNLVTIGTGATVFTLSTETVIDVATDNTLVLNANVSGNNTLTKRGGGTLEFTGTADNASTGLRSVNEGTLRLNKTANNIQAVDNTLTINDLGNFDGVGSALVIYGAGAANDQIDNNDAVIINANGRFDFNGGTDQFGAITVAGGALANSEGGGTITSTGLTINGGSIATGTGTLTVNGNITYTAGLSVGAAPTIAGNLNLGGDVRSFTINDGPWVDDLVIDALITNGRLLKLGTGSLGLTHSGNTFNLANANETQTVTAPATVTTFTLTFNGYTTPAITRATDTAGTIQAFLEALPSIGAGNVLVSGAVAGPYTVTFQGALAATNVAALTATLGTGTGTIAIATTVAGQSAAANEIQLVTVPATVTAFTLTFDTVASAPITNPATPATVRAALELIPSIGAGNVLVSGNTGGPFIIEFINALAGVNVSALAAATTGGTGTITIATPISGQAAVELQAGTVAIASPTALGGASTQINVSGNVTLRPLGVDLVGAAAIANPIHYQTFISNSTYTDVANNRTLTLGGRRDFGGTWGIELSGVQLQRTASALNGQTQSIAVVDPLVNALISGEIAGGNANLQFRKEGFGTLAFSGNNSYQGATIINQGILIARANNALGSVNQGTTITSGA
ncbi:MAG TPA: autotransporter-associated beta strand repeat-containing protein, partial [Pirellulaceae bacterium]|nr:autotransporter-associated beta strand repeat-containing protein [Pirellulaceae bacterium]